MGRRADDGKRDEWIQRFRRRETSGLTVATFCEWESVSVAAFYSWQKKLRARSRGHSISIADFLVHNSGQQARVAAAMIAQGSVAAHEE